MGWPPDASVGFHWVIESNYRGAGGSGGQIVELYPEDDMVLVVVAGGGTPYGGCSNPEALSAPLYSQFIRPATVSASALPPNPAGVAALAAEVAAAAASYEGPPRPVPALPATALTISDRRFVLEPNPLEIGWFSLSFPGGSEATLQVSGEEEVTFRVGLDDVFRHAPGEFGLPAAVKGWWAGGTRFVALIDQYAIFAYLRVTMDFTGNGVTITIDDLACPGGGSLTLSGSVP